MFDVRSHCLGNEMSKQIEMNLSLAMIVWMYCLTPSACDKDRAVHDVQGMPTSHMAMTVSVSLGTVVCPIDPTIWVPGDLDVVHPHPSQIVDIFQDCVCRSTHSLRAVPRKVGGWCPSEPCPLGTHVHASVSCPSQQCRHSSMEPAHKAVHAGHFCSVDVRTDLVFFW